jgi:adenylylsulfate reductase subunit B
VKACPQHAIDARGYSDFAPLGHSVRVLREPDKGTVSWKIRYRDERIKEFMFAIRTTPWDSIKPPSEYAPPDPGSLDSLLLAHEPEALMIESLPALTAKEKG